MKGSTYNFIMGLVALIIFGCGGGGGNSSDPITTSSLTLSADVVGSTKNVGMVVRITADIIVPGGGAAPDGTPVSFALAGTSGNLSATSASTFGGKAVVTLTSTAYGLVTVTATTSDVSAQVSVMFYDSGLPSTINLTHTSSIGVQADPAGVTVSATVRDGNGNLVANDTAVNFTSNHGTLTSVTTTSGGVATANLFFDGVGTVRVAGSVKSINGTISGTDDINFAPLNLVAHRGYGMESPENTIAAFNKALTLGATALECDLHVSSDGGVMVIHGTTVNGTTNGTGAVSDLTTTALRSLDAGANFNAAYAGEKIPLFSELISVVASHPGISMLPEIKGYRTSADIALMVQPVIDAGLETRTTFQSFKFSDLSSVRLRSSAVRIAYLCSTLADFNMAIIPAQADGKADIFIAWQVVASNPEVVGRAAAAGVGLTVWTVNSWDTVQKMQLSGVTNIMSDWGLANLKTR